MRLDVTWLWIAVALQMVALAWTTWRLRSIVVLGHHEDPDLRGQQLPTQLLAPVKAASAADAIRAFIFVNAGCSHCEHMLARAEERSVFSGMSNNVALVGVGAPDHVAEHFVAWADKLGLGLMACARPKELGLQHVPWYIVRDPDNRILAYGSARQFDAMVHALRGLSADPGRPRPA
jgi:hypothetical protein